MLPRHEFLQVVKTTPLVSIDLIVRDETGKVLVGLRTNNPARGTWFVPGGVIFKDERFAAAFHRISMRELGCSLEISSARLLGVYEHFYDANFADVPGFGTHYVVMGYEICIDGPLMPPPDQHSQYRWLTVEEILNDPSVHENTKAYFR